MRLRTPMVEIAAPCPVSSALSAPPRFERFHIERGISPGAVERLPVARNKKAISLERQVCIAAGMLVVAGAALGFFVHSYFIGISAFVGAGLVFAGITDTCAMGMMIARMPWNQVEDATCCKAQ